VIPTVILLVILGVAWINLPPSGPNNSGACPV